MSLKGKKFSFDDLPEVTRSKTNGGRMNREMLQHQLDEQTKRWTIVAYDDSFDPPLPLVAEEVHERALRKLSPDARVIATMMLRHDPAIRLEIARAFDASGELILPFRAA